MRKGDEKRREMLAVAERLFCLRGYEATSVQDILDVLGASKGGFYHHFASKEALLVTLCEQRAQQALEATEQALLQHAKPMERLNCVLHGFLPLRLTEVPFLNMLLPLMSKPQNKALLLQYEESITASFLPVMEREIAFAEKSEVIFPRIRNSASMVAAILHTCWKEIAREMLDWMEGVADMDISALLEHLTRMRKAIEVLLDAPYGSVEVITLPEWGDVAAELIRLRMAEE